jgi:hypothetical protein
LEVLQVIVAGMGGKALAAVLRPLIVNYRYYSGGLPDLLLVRVMRREGGEEEGPRERRGEEGHRRKEMEGGMEGEGGDATGLEGLVAVTGLPGWVLERVGRRRGERGGSNGGGGGRGRGRGGSFPWQEPGSGKAWPPLASTGESGDGCGRREEEVRVPKLLGDEDWGRWRCEVVLGEVKSENDRLDPRQEAWLHILTAAGVVAKVMKVRTPGRRKGERAGRRAGGQDGGDEFSGED